MNKVDKQILLNKILTAKNAVEKAKNSQLLTACQLDHHRPLEHFA